MRFNTIRAAQILYYLLAIEFLAQFYYGKNGLPVIDRRLLTCTRITTFILFAATFFYHIKITCNTKSEQEQVLTSLK